MHIFRKGKVDDVGSYLVQCSTVQYRDSPQLIQCEGFSGQRERWQKNWDLSHPICRLIPNLKPAWFTSLLTSPFLYFPSLSSPPLLCTARYCCNVAILSRCTDMNRMRGEWWPGPRLIVEGAPQREKEKKRKGRGRKEMGHGWPDKGWSLLCPTPRRWSKNDKQSHWLSDWLTDWLIDRLIHGLIDSLTDLLTDSLTDWLSNKVIQWRTYWLTDRLTTFDSHSTQQVSPVLFYTIYPDQLSSAQLCSAQYRCSWSKSNCIACMALHRVQSTQRSSN